MLRVGCSQLIHGVDHPAARLDLHLAKIAQARQAGIEVLVFPETSLPGYPTGAEVPRVAIKRSARELTTLAEACTGISVALGFVELAPGGLYYNSLAWLRDGQVQSVHRKVNLATYGNLDEGKHFAHGERVDVVPVGEDWTAAGLICADIWNPALLYLAAMRRATVLAAPIASAVEAVGDAFDNPSNWDINSRYGAMTYGLPTVRCNWAGSFGAMKFWGGSAIFDAFGQQIARAGEGEELIHADLDLDQVHTARFLLPTMRDGNPALIRRELDRLLSEDPL